MSAFPVETDEQRIKRLKDLLDNDVSIIALREKQAKERERRKHSKLHQPRIPLLPDQIPYYYGFADKSSSFASSSSSIGSNGNSAHFPNATMGSFNNMQQTTADLQESAFGGKEGSPLSIGMDASDGDIPAKKRLLERDPSLIALREMQMRRRQSKFNQRRIPLLPEQIPYYYGFADKSASFVSPASTIKSASFVSPSSVIGSNGNNAHFQNTLGDYNDTQQMTAELQLSAFGDEEGPQLGDAQIGKKSTQTPKMPIPSNKNKNDKKLSVKRPRSSAKEEAKKSSINTPHRSEYVRVKTPKPKVSSPKEGRRRSTRNRIPPVARFMGQRVIYKYEDGNATMMGVEKVQFKRTDRSKYAKFAPLEAVRSPVVPDDL